MIDLAKEILQSLNNSKLRTALTGFAVAWGIFMLITLLGVSRGVYNSVNSNFADQNYNALELWGGFTSMAYNGLKEGRAIELQNQDVSVLKEKNRGLVATATATVENQSATFSSLKESLSMGYTGVYPQADIDYKKGIVAGRCLNDQDMNNKRKVIVVNETLARQFFPNRSNEDIIGKYLTCNGLSWEIVGIYRHDWRTDAYVPFSTAMMLSENKNTVGSIQVTLNGLETEEDADEAEQKLRATIGRQHNFNPNDNSAVYTWNKFSGYLSANEAMSILNIAVWIIGIFTMLSGIVGVSNIMFVSVKERTHEIGIRRAIGAKPRNILTQIILESVTITTFFGYIGVFLGIVSTEIISKLAEDSDILKNPTVEMSIAIRVTIVLIVAGAIAGLFPAIKATKVKPVEALRTE